jgi:hypothetical protein
MTSGRQPESTFLRRRRDIHLIVRTPASVAMCLGSPSEAARPTNPLQRVLSHLLRVPTTKKSTLPLMAKAASSSDQDDNAVHRIYRVRFALPMPHSLHRIKGPPRETVGTLLLSAPFANDRSGDRSCAEGGVVFGISLLRHKPANWRGRGGSEAAGTTHSQIETTARVMSKMTPENPSSLNAMRIASAEVAFAERAASC